MTIAKVVVNKQIHNSGIASRSPSSNALKVKGPRRGGGEDRPVLQTTTRSPRRHKPRATSLTPGSAYSDVHASAQRAQYNELSESGGTGPLCERIMCWLKASVGLKPHQTHPVIPLAKYIYHSLSSLSLLPDVRSASTRRAEYEGDM